MHKKLILFREFKEANDIDIDSITQIEILKDTTIYKKQTLEQHTSRLDCPHFTALYNYLTVFVSIAVDKSKWG
mgnify:CR=1 FL=1